MQNLRLWTAIVTGVLVLLSVDRISAAPLNIEFEPGQLSTSGYLIAIPSYTENDFVFTADGFGGNLTNGSPSTVASVNSSFTHNGTGFLALSGLSGGSTNISMEGTLGQSFDFISFDGAEYRAPVGGASAVRITVIGTKQTGGTVVDSFLLDLIADGLNGADDFQNFMLANTFTDLIKLSFYGIPGTPAAIALNHVEFALDNIQLEVAQVPLPAALPMLASAFGFFGFVVWRRKNAIST